MFIKLKNIFIVFFIFVFLTSCSKLPRSEDKTILRFSSWGSKSEVSILIPLIKEFEEKNPSIRVEFIHIPKNYFQKLHLLVASNLTPDVVFINNINGKVYIQNNVLENLIPYLKNDKNLSQKDFFPRALDGFRYKKFLYAVPRDVSNIVVCYNKNVFDKYKVPYPKANWTFEDYLKTAKLLTKDTNNDGKTDIFGSSFEENPLFWLPFLWSNGGGLISEDMKKVILDKSESIEAINFYSDLRNKWHVAPMPEEQGSATMAQLFIQNRLAMHISGRWSVPVYRKTEGLRWDVTAFPRGKKGSIVDADASGWGISRNSTHKKEAWALIKFLASQKASEEFAKAGLIVPARVDVANSQVFLATKENPKNSKVFVDIIPSSIPTPSNENYQEIVDIVTQEMEPVFRGIKSANDVVNTELGNKIKKLLK